jgi:hypothetical protein
MLGMSFFNVDIGKGREYVASNKQIMTGEEMAVKKFSHGAPSPKISPVDVHLF